MDTAIKKRDYGFDTIKALLIVLVVLGHVMEEISTKGGLGIVRAVIYSFHMPMFVFISGYFSRNSKSACGNAFVSCFAPYLIFNTLYVIAVKHTFEINVFTPVYTFWYLLSLFFWRLSAKSLSKIRFIVILSFIVGLYCGCFDVFDRFLSLSRTFCFLPFFLLGYQFSESKIERLRSVNKLFPALALLAAAAATVYLNIRQIIPVKMYELIQSYEKTKVGVTEGMIMRAVIYLLALVMIFAVIALVPNKKTFLSPLGSRTICIYLLSSFIIKSAFMLLKQFSVISLENAVAQCTVILLLTVITLAVTGNKLVFNIYQKLIELIKKCFILP